MKNRELKEILFATAVGAGDLIAMAMAWRFTTWSIQWVVFGATFIYTFVACALYFLAVCTRQHIRHLKAENRRKMELAMKQKRKRKIIDYNVTMRTYGKDDPDFFEVPAEEVSNG